MGRSKHQLRRIATELLTHPEQSYTEIAGKVGIDTARPGINLYQTINTDGYKKVEAEIAAKILNAEEVKQKISDKTNSPNESVAIKALELMSKVHGLLTEKTQIIVKPNTADLTDISTEDIQSELVKRLRVGQAGVFKSPDGEHIAPCQAIDSNPKQAIDSEK